MVINLHEQSESEQESEPYGGDHPAAIDHSVGQSSSSGWVFTRVWPITTTSTGGEQTQNTDELYNRENRLHGHPESAKHLRHNSLELL
jgi:hypothetical protein